MFTYWFAGQNRSESLSNFGSSGEMVLEQHSSPMVREKHEASTPLLVEFKNHYRQFAAPGSNVKKVEMK